MESVDGIWKFLELTPRVLFAVWVFGALVLFLPDSVAMQLALVSFREQHRSWIGPGTLASFILWLSYAAVRVPRWFRRKWAMRRGRAWVLARLDALSQEERITLGYFVRCGAPTQPLWAHFPAARSLCAKGLLRPVAGIGVMFAFPHEVPDFVWQEMMTRREELFPGWNSPAAGQLYDNFEDFQREQTLFRR